jgi:ribosomal subunit interface protein
MKVNYVQKHLQLSEGQKEYIEEKLSHLKKYRRVEDESTLIQVNVEFFDSKVSDDKISFVVNMILPHATVRAEVSSKTVEEGADVAYDKLKIQLEKYKERHA